MTYADKTLRCRDCGTDFLFSAGEQEFYSAKGLMNEPQRCPACRAIKRQQRNASPGMGQDRQMYPAICAECGAETQVPFLPRNDRPVYCSTCFDRVRVSR